ncbi:MAG TPA: hypothetical protein ENN45_03860, partial [Bacteroidetes bacterium]|nr:hypothetical protein [Bacteroidota bacterium]
MNEKKLKISGLMFAGVIIIVSFVYAVNIQPVVIGHDTYFAPYSELKTFVSYGDLTDFLHGQSKSPSINLSRVSSVSGIAFQMEMDAVFLSSSVSTMKNGGTIVDYSQTNVQVSGVDEPDIVKTDGEYLYIVTHNKVIIIKATPAEDAEIECEITVDSSLTIQNIFIKGDRLVIFAQDYEYPLYKIYIDEPLLIDDEEIVDVTETEVMPNPRWHSSPDTHILVYYLE